MRQDPFGPPETHQDLPQSSKTQWGPSRLAETFWSTPLPIGTWWNPLKTGQDPLWPDSQVFGGLWVHQCISARFFAFLQVSANLNDSCWLSAGLGGSWQILPGLSMSLGYWMVPNVTRRNQVVSYGIDWYWMAPNGTKWHRTNLKGF